MQNLIELTEEHCDIIRRPGSVAIHFKNGEIVISGNRISFEWYDDYADVDVIDSISDERMSIVSSDDYSLILHLNGEIFEFVYRR